MVQMIAVLLLPPKAFCSILVNLESRKDTCCSLNNESQFTKNVYHALYFWYDNVDVEIKKEAAIQH